MCGWDCGGDPPSKFGPPCTEVNRLFARPPRSVHVRTFLFDQDGGISTPRGFSCIKNPDHLGKSRSKNIHRQNMDALSIVVASVGLVSVCGKLFGHISWLTNKLQAADKDLEALSSEIGVFSEVLEDIGGSFCDPSIAKSVFVAKTAHEEQHWRDVKQAMEECKRMLEDLHRNLQPDRNHIRGGRALINVTSEELSRSHHQMMAYRRTMEMSQDIIRMYIPLSTLLT
jgi:hypothetical protein